MPEIEVLLAFLVVVLTFVVVYLSLSISRLGRSLGNKIFEERKDALRTTIEESYRTKLDEWKVQYEEWFRRDALEKSRIVLKGKIGEQMAPLFKVFGHDPSDARFLGSPVDYVIFDKYTVIKERREDVPMTIVFADIKTGEAVLTYEQRRIKEAIEKGRVKWETIRL